MDHRQRLRELLIRRSLERGDFTLASGARSNYYIDARRTTMTAEGLWLTGVVGLGVLRTAGVTPSHVGGLTMGADPVSYAIARASWDDPPVLDAFSVRKEAKAHGTGRRIEGGLPDGSAVVVIEDSMTTGGSSARAIEAIRGAGHTVLSVLTVVDREEGGRERMAELGVPLLSIFTARELLDPDPEGP